MEGRIIFHKRQCYLEDKNGKIIMYGQMQGRLYLIDASTTQSKEFAHYASQLKLSWDQWHRRYGHISTSSLERLIKEGMVNGILINQTTSPSKSCEACIEAKQAHKPFPKEAENRSQIPGEQFMSDVWGPARVESIGKWKWYISFMDDCTRYGTVLFLKQKSDATG